MAQIAHKLHKLHLRLESSLNKLIPVDKTTPADVQLLQNSPKLEITFQTKYLALKQCKIFKTKDMTQ